MTLDKFDYFIASGAKEAILARINDNSVTNLTFELDAGDDTGGLQVIINLYYWQGTLDGYRLEVKKMLIAEFAEWMNDVPNG